MTTGERLQDIITSPRWREHFSALSQALGFSLSAYSDAGEPLFSSACRSPFCASLQDSLGCRAQSMASCRAQAMEALATGQPRWYTCPAKVSGFSLPLFYLDERAVIQGQGSFASYDDFRAYLELLRSCAAETPLPVTATLRFTSEQDARNACLLIDRSIKLLLRNTEETVALKRRMVSFKEIMGTWSSAAETDAPRTYENLVRSVGAVMGIEEAAVLLREPRSRAYTVAHRAGGADAVRDLPADSPVIWILQNGQPFVLSADTEPHPRAGGGQGGARYFFAVRVQGVLEGILQVGGRPLSEGDAQAVASLCRQVSLTIENGKLHRAISRKWSRIDAIMEVAQEIAGIRSSESLLQSILDKSAKLLMAERGSLMLLDRETDALFVEAKTGAYENAEEKIRVARGEGIAGRVAEQGEPYLVQNVESDPRTLQKNRSKYKTPSFVSVPLKIGDRTIGVLNLADKTTGEVFDRDDLHLIQSFATHAAVVLERNALEGQTERLKKLSITDPLTGLLNRRYLRERLDEEVSRSERTGRPMTLLMIDVDDFKRFNDTFGHLAGDNALRHVGESLLKTVRHMDIIARYAGDEFVVILPETDTALAMQIAERIRQEIAAIRFPGRGGKAVTPGVITASIGVATYPAHGADVDRILEQTDQALYSAKARGRNRIEVFA